MEDLREVIFEKMDDNTATAVESSQRGQLTPPAKALLEQLQANGFQSWSTLGLEGARAAILEMKALAGPVEPVARVKPITITRADGSELQGQIYIPDSQKSLPVLVYLHGGGWAIGNHMLVDPLVRTLANRAGCAMLSIDYRLAPENKYPAALEDVYQALQWVISNAEEWRIDPHRIGVGGDSSGANLAAAVSLLCRDRGGPVILFQLLVYPAVDHNYQNESYERFGDGASSALSRADAVWFHALYTNSPEELDSPYVSPLRANSLVGMPRTLLVAAEIDPLLQEGLEYAQRLEAAGVPVERKVYPGMFHGFFRTPGALPEAREAIDYVAGRFRESMHAG